MHVILLSDHVTNKKSFWFHVNPHVSVSVCPPCPIKCNPIKFLLLV